jgi:capsular exopolysaccharide synthesis family protein
MMQEAPGSSLDLEQIWFVVREKAWLIGLCGLIGIFAGLAYIHHTPLTYYAQAVLEVDPTGPDAMKEANLSDVPGDETDPLGEEMGQTLLAEFRGRPFAQQVIKDNGLMNNPDFAKPGPDGKPLTMDEAAGELIGMSRVTIRAGTRFIDVGVMYSNPELAKEIADMMANEYILQTMQQHDANSDLAISYLTTKASEYSKRLSGDAQKLQDYVKSTNSGSLVGDQDTVVSELKAKNTELSEAHTQRIRLDADDEEIQKHIDDPAALLSIPSVANQPEIVQSLALIKEINARIDVLKLRYTEKHPKMIQARTELADEENTLSQELRNVPPVIHAAREAAMEMEQRFTAEVQAQQSAAMSLNQQHIKYDLLSREVETDQAIYDGILTRLKEAQVSNGAETTNVHLFDTAQVPVEPMQARKSRTLAIALGGGLVVGLLLSIGLHFLDTSVKAVDQAEDVLGLTVLASIPRQNQRGLKESSLSLLNSPGSVVAEAFRSLRTAVFLAGRTKGRKIILFTSTLAGEGKTFCSTNYATALAQQELRTLLIDADLRSPMIRTVMLADKKLPGLAELLSKKVDIEGAIHPSQMENLWIMPAGDLVPNPAELLARSDMGELMRQLGEKFDRIVIDTAPVTAVSDTLLLLEHAQAICLVVHAGRTQRKWIMRAIKLINEAGSKPDGVILNQVPMRMAAAYSYYPGRYGQPEVYGSNAHRNGSGKQDGKKDGKKDEPEMAEAAPRF